MTRDSWNLVKSNSATINISMTSNQSKKKCIFSCLRFGVMKDAYLDPKKLVQRCTLLASKIDEAYQ